MENGEKCDHYGGNARPALTIHQAPAHQNSSGSHQEKYRAHGEHEWRHEWAAENFVAKQKMRMVADCHDGQRRNNSKHADYDPENAQYAKMFFKPGGKTASLPAG